MIFIFYWTAVLSGTYAQFDESFTLKSGSSRLEPHMLSSIYCFSDANGKKTFPGLLNTGHGPILPTFTHMSWNWYDDIPKLAILSNFDKSNHLGALQCSIVRNHVETKIVILKLPSANLAELSALTPYNVADKGDDVVLRVKVAKQLDQPIRWRHNGMQVNAWNDQLEVTLEDVHVSDSGIFECYYEDRRKEGIHALTRLIVRSCLAEFYGDDCDKECPSCYNGGICHDRYGVCVCPAGFTGTNCEIACGGNHIGSDCSKFCADPSNIDGNPDEFCASYFFCKPDPYGCSCAPGFKGLECKEHCEQGRYGADCKQPCHCADGVEACNRITGACEGGCANGWRGNSCQIKVCPKNHFGKNCKFTCHCEGGSRNCDAEGFCYYGCEAGWTGVACQRECPPGSFGRNCASTCHCHENSTTPCDKKTGVCDGACEAGYTGQNCQRPCLPNTYGVNCLETCNCYNGGQCNRVDGSCTCVGLWTGLYCNESKPQIIPAIDDTRIIQGGQVLISCTAHAIPGPLISIVSREFPDLNVNIKLLELYLYQALVNVTLQTSGAFEFFCTAQNRHGYDMKNVTVIVID